MKLEIELVPSTIWFSNVRKLVPREIWDTIRKRSYKEANYRCQICGTNNILHCHEIWEYDDEKRIQHLKDFISLCENCHMIKHAGFSMHTPEGQENFDRDELIDHFCKVNECKKEAFFKHEDEAFKVWKERSKHEWKQNFGEYSRFIKK